MSATPDSVPEVGQRGTMAVGRDDYPVQVTDVVEKSGAPHVFVADCQCRGAFDPSTGDVAWTITNPLPTAMKSRLTWRKGKFKEPCWQIKRGWPVSFAYVRRSYGPSF